MVGRADGDPVYVSIRALHLGAEAVELLVLGEEGTAGEEAVHDADTVELVVCSHQCAAGLLDGSQVSRSDVSAGAYKSKIVHAFVFCCEIIAALAAKGTSKRLPPIGLKNGTSSRFGFL